MLLARTAQLRLMIAVRVEEHVVCCISMLRKNDSSKIAEERAGGLAERVHDEFLFLAGAG